MLSPTECPAKVAVLPVPDLGSHLMNAMATQWNQCVKDLKNRILSCSRKPTPQRSSKACFHEQPARNTWKYHLSLELGLANGITAIQDRLDTALAEGPEGCESERCADRIKQDLRQSDLRIPRC